MRIGRRSSNDDRYCDIDKKTAASQENDSAIAARTARKKKFIISIALLLCIFSVAWAVLSHVNFLGEFVRTEVETIAAQEINASVTLGEISGNPVTGFSIADVAVSRGGKKLVAAKNITAAISFSSLISGNPKLSYIGITGAETSVADILDLIPEQQEESDEPTDIPIKEVRIEDSILHTDYGDVSFSESTIEIENSDNYTLDIACRVKSNDMRLTGNIGKAQGVWCTDGLTVAVEDGDVKVAGALYPSMDVKISINELNLTDITELVPQTERYGVRGILSGKAVVSGSGENITTSGSGKLHNALISGIPIEELRTEWDVKPGHISVDLENGKVFDSHIAGKFRMDYDDGKDYAELKMNVENLSFADWTPQFEKQTGGNVIHLNGGISSLSADLSGPLDALVGDISLAPSDIGYNEIKITSLAGCAKFNGKPVGNVDFSGKAHGKNISLKGILSFGKKMPSNFEMKVENFPIEKIIKSIPQAGDINVSGLVSFSGKCTGIFGSWVVDASASSPAITADKVGKVSDISLAAAYNMNTDVLSVKKSSAIWNGAKITANGTVGLSTESDKQLNISGAFSKVNSEKLAEFLSAVNDLNIKAVASGTFKVTGSISAPKVQAKISATNGRFLQLAVDRAEVGIDYAGQSVHLDPINVSACGGRASLVCDVAIPEGDAPAQWKVKGNIFRTGADVIDGILDTKTDLSGKVSGSIEAENENDGVKWKADLRSDSITWDLPDDIDVPTKSGRRIKAEDFSASAYGDPREITITDASGKIFKGRLNIKGKITMPQKDAPFTDAGLDITADLQKMNLYEFTRRHVPAVRQIQGLVTANVKITGKAGDPDFNGSGSLAPFRFRSFGLPMLNIKYHGNKNDIVLNEIKAMLKKGSLKAYARISKDGENSEWSSQLSINGKNIDMYQFAGYLPESFRKSFGGTATFTYNGKGKGERLAGKGEFSSPQMKIMGIKFDALSAPFFVTDKYIMVEDLNCKVSGGKLNGGFGLDLETNEWGSNCTLMGAETAKILKEAFPDMEGSITGTGDVKARFGGVIGRDSTTAGGIAIQLHDGEVKGFEAAEELKKLTHGAPIRFKSVQTSITYDAGDINILPGTQATAPEDDPVYNYIMLDGFIGVKENIRFFGMGKVNVRALNSLIGTFDTLAATGADYVNNGEFDKGAMVKSILGSVVKGLTKDDFRFVTLSVKGTLDDPVFYDIKLQNTSKMQSSAKDSIPTSAGDPDAKSLKRNNESKFVFKFEIPVGPGKSKTRNAKGDAIGQTLENLIQNIDFGL
ncbi:MAG: hypothetical protein Q4E17_02570 [Synergistes sp.]|nr:hypothetical protein [Synergistes sp.]